MQSISSTCNINVVLFCYLIFCRIEGSFPHKIWTNRDTDMAEYSKSIRKTHSTRLEGQQGHQGHQRSFKGHLTKNHFFLCIFCKNYIDDPHFLFGSIIRTPKSYSRTSAGSKTLFRLKIELKLDVWWQKALPNFLLKQQCYHIFKTSYPKQITSDTKVCLPILISMTDNVHNRKLVGLG